MWLRSWILQCSVECTVNCSVQQYTLLYMSLLLSFTNTCSATYKHLTWSHFQILCHLLKITAFLCCNEDNLQYTNYVNCYEGSEYKQIIFNASQSSTRNHSYANLLESNSRADLQGIFFGSGNQVIDNKTVVNHFAPSCSSDQKYKGVYF